MKYVKENHRKGPALRFCSKNNAFELKRHGSAAKVEFLHEVLVKAMAAILQRYE